MLVAEEMGAARFRIAGQTRQTFLVPELCRPTGLTDKQRENFYLMRAMAEKTLQNPKLRVEKLYDFMEKLLEYGFRINRFFLCFIINLLLAIHASMTS